MTAPTDSRELLVVGPLLRYADATSATVWVETAVPAEVAVLGRRTRTFEVAGHHYGYLHVDGLAPGTDTVYDVRLDGEVVWPPADDARPAPRLRTLRGDDRLDLVFGSCRHDRPQERPWTLTADEHAQGVGPDALQALALACQRGERPLPDLLLLLGDQVYADDGLSPAVQRRVVARRGRAGPSDQLVDFEEYTWLYADSWRQPEVRWLLSTVPSAMVCDDHDVHDGWNSSAAWRAAQERRSTWPRQLEAALSAYWLYQHLGNLPPDEHEPLLADVGEHGEQALLGFIRAIDQPGRTTGFGYVRDLGPVRLVVLDSRGGRVLEESARSVLTEGEWARLGAELRGDCDHLLVASSLPVLLEPALHDIERWNAAVCAGQWGRVLTGLGERLRQAFAFEHWAAFPASFTRLVDVLHDVVNGRRGSAPASVVLLSGDVHHSYVAPMRLEGPRSAVVQVVSSPFRQAFGRRLRAQIRLASTPLLRLAGRVLARLARLPDPPASWSITTGPLFGNGLGTLVLEGRTAHLRLDGAVLDGEVAALQRVHEQRIAGARAD
jgi:hypothetical protein